MTNDELLSSFSELISFLSEFDFEEFTLFHQDIISGADEESQKALRGKLEMIKKFARDVLLNFEAMNLEDEKKSFRRRTAKNLISVSNDLNLISQPGVAQRIPVSFEELERLLSALNGDFSDLAPSLPKTFGRLKTEEHFL